MIAASTITSPIAAFREISPPHVGPTSSMFTSTGSMPACSASSRRITSDSLIPSPVSEGVRIDTASSFTIWTSAPSTAPRASPAPARHRPVARTCIRDPRASFEVDRVVQVAEQEARERDGDEQSRDREPAVRSSTQRTVIV